MADIRAAGLIFAPFPPWVQDGAPTFTTFFYKGENISYINDIYL